MKQLFKVFMAAAVIIFASCQKNDLNEPGKNETGQAILTASIGDMTKVGFEDQNTSGLKVTWSAGDKIGLYDESGDYACVFALKAGEEGKTKAEFIAQGGSFDPTKTYTAVYPHIAGTLDLTEYANAKNTRLAADQTQDGATLDHLAKLCFMEGANTQNSITFAYTSSILTLKLEKPAAAGAIEVLKSIGFTNDSKSYKLNLTNGNWTNTAYMVIDPIADPARMLNFETNTDAGRIYNYAVTTDKEYEAGKRYTATLTGGKLAENNIMKFTIDTRKNIDDATDKTFIMPFTNNGVISGYGITIEWGDGKTSNFPDGATITQATLTHAYATAGEYQITIRSTETNSAKKQMPIINFNTNFGTVNNNLAKLISMDTPMLNTAETDFAACFHSCINLTTLPIGLFDKNTQVTSFWSCFRDCTNLTTIPTGLFDKNTKVTTFGTCFTGCSSLTTLPTGLFAKNTAVTSFNSSFQNCVKLQLHPNIFCNEATEKTTRFAGKTVNFSSCFDRASFTGTQGTAPALWEYAGTLTKTKCFNGAGNSLTSITNYGSIPADWKQ